MKKNILTIIIMAIVLINTILTGVLIFVIVPSANKTTQLVSKVASIIDLELESPDAAEAEITVADITNFSIPNDMTINLKPDTDGKPKYALLKDVSISMNNKHKDFVDLEPKMTENISQIKEIIESEVGKYTFEEVTSKKDAIKQAVLIRLQELFKSDFIINISIGNMLLSE